MPRGETTGEGGGGLNELCENAAADSDQIPSSAQSNFLNPEILSLAHTIGILVRPRSQIDGRTRRGRDPSAVWQRMYQLCQSKMQVHLPGGERREL
jgi:hypothetical protein